MMILVVMVALSLFGFDSPVHAQSTGGIHGSVYTAMLRDRIGPIAGDAAANGGRIYVPEFPVDLVNESSGATVAKAKTDLFGRFRFLYAPAGRYRVCWNAPGWVSSCSPEKISVKDAIIYMNSIAVRPEFKKSANGGVRGAFWGRVELADKSSPYFNEEYFGVNRTAEVTVTNIQGSTLRKTVSNAYGEFVAVDVPAEPLRTIARFDAAHAGLATPSTTVSTGSAITLTLSNARPVFSGIAAKRGGKGVREVTQGAQLNVAAEVRDPDGDPLVYQWKPAPGSGQIISSTGGHAVWRLGPTQGLQKLYLLVSDGKGGYGVDTLSIKTTAADVTFSGKVVAQTNAPIASPTVTINGRSIKGDVSGAFFAKVPQSSRYVVNVSAPGFVPASRVFDRSGVYNEYQLAKATVLQINPAAAVNIVDRPQEGRSKLRPASIRLAPGSLVGPDGKKPAGALLAHIATIDIANAEMPGDFGARTNGRETNLISYGAVFAEFVDASGKHYNLAPGKYAEVIIPPPVSLRKPPAKIALWSYNDKTGYWDDLKTTAFFDAKRRVYVGKVPHFSVINTDISKNTAACVRVLLDNIDRNQLKARVSYDSGGTPFAQTPEFTLGDALNAIYRLPDNTNVKITLLDATNNSVVGTAKLLDANQHVLANNVVNTGPASTPLWPNTPYDNCVTTSVRLDVPAGSISRIPFLSFEGEGTEDQAVGYYQALDSALHFDPVTKTWSGGTHSTLGDWWAQAGFDPATGAGGTRASYLNHNDLGFGRDMHMLKKPTGEVYAYVTNYGDHDQNPANADDALNQSPATQGATVAMEYTPLAGVAGNIVKFFVFNNGQASGKLVNSADLDGFGQKFVPNLCVNCHGGEFYSPANPASPTPLEVSLRPSLAATIGASFREFDTASFRYPGGAVTLPAGLRQSFYDLNQLTKATNPQSPITDLIDNWYSGIAPTDPPITSYTPSGWIDASQPQKEQLYQQVVATSCRTCHVAFSQTSPSSGITWTSYAQFNLHKGTTKDYVCGDNKVMPHALMTYRNFWLSTGPHRPDILGNFTASDWPSFGGCQ